jgi:hypothetical protein
MTVTNITNLCANTSKLFAKTTNGRAKFTGANANSTDLQAHIVIRVESHVNKTGTQQAGVIK